MKVDSVPNKYEIFQDYYLDVNGEEISYSEALALYKNLNEEERNDFEQYYKDETGYEIIDANGYSFGENASEKNNINKANIITKYNIEAYAKKNGLVLDPIWSQYSAEEILQMADNGVNIPQEILDIAHTIQQQTASNYETTGKDEETNTEETTEKEPFLELIPKAEKKIEKCEENNEKISDEIESILPETQKQEKSLADRLKKQRNTLDEYEGNIREWSKLQDKVNNGEALSSTEARRYAEITGMLEDKNSNSDDFQIDKTEISRSLNKINILAVLGEELANETIEIGDTLIDYTSQENYKTTRKTTSQQIGFLRSIVAMAQGKTLAEEASKTGNNTKEYTEETTNSVNDIASLLGIESSIANNESNAEPSAEQKTPEENSVEESAKQTAKTGQAQGNIPVDNEKTEQSLALQQSNDTQEEDFIITDENVNTLIEESGIINSDLIEQIKYAFTSTKTAKSDRLFAKFVDKKISALVKKFQEEETRRQDVIKNKEQENNKAKSDIEDLTGKSSDEIEEELNSQNSQDNSNEYMDDSSKNKVRQRKQTISDNNKEIIALNTESGQAIEEFKNNTKSEQNRLNKSIPEETENLSSNNKYLNETIPYYKERLSFAQNSGITLSKMGRYRVTVGFEQLASFQIKKGLNNIKKGRTSVTIGNEAEDIARKPFIKIAEKSTKNAISTNDEALTALSALNTKIVSVTGEDTAAPASTTETGTSEVTDNDTEQNEAQSGNVQKPAAGEYETELSPTSSQSDTPVTAMPVQAETRSATTNTNPAESSDEESVQSPAEKVEETVEKPQADAIEEEKTDNSKTDNTQKIDEEKDTEKTLNTAQSESSSGTSSEEEEITTDEAQDSVDDAKSNAKDDGKESEDTKKDTEKTTKELEKETKQLVKLMKKDEKEILKSTKESAEAAKKQEEILNEFETLVNENEQLISEDENKQNSQPVQSAAPQSQDNSSGMQQTTAMGVAAMAIGGGQQNSNADKIASNDQRINELGISFQTYGRKIEKHRTKLVAIQKTTKTRQKKYNKKTDLIEQKNKEVEEKENAKQKRLQTQLGAVGIAENVFQITLSTGQIMCMVVLPPWIPAAGAIMVTVGQYGVLACGVTKGVINIANGNLTAGLIAIGQSAISLATGGSNITQGAGGVLTAVSAGLNIVSSSADLVNNTRAVQGKEASGVFSKISTISGVASSLTNSAATISNLGQNGTSTFGKAMKIASVAGTAMSSASQLMSEFGAEGGAANILGIIGGAVSTMSAIGMIADKKFSNASEKNKENQEKTEASEKNKENSDKTEVKEDNKTGQDKNDVDKNNKESLDKTDSPENNEENQIKTVAENNVENAESTDKKVENTNNDKLQRNDLDNNTDNAPTTSESNESKPTRDPNAPIEDKPVSPSEIAKGSNVDALTADAQQKMAVQSAQIKKEQNQQIETQIRKENRKESWSNFTEAISGIASTGASFLGSGSNEQQQKKKTAPRGRLTKRAKEIIEKNNRRIAALSRMGYNLA